MHQTKEDPIEFLNYVLFCWKQLGHASPMAMQTISGIDVRF
jgi:hypothetical protein